MPKMTITQLVDGSYNRVENTSFTRGVEAGESMEYVAIAVNNVWGGRAKDGGCVSSYEKIGYHTGSTDFIRGVLSTGCPVKVYRYGDTGLVEFELVDE